LYILERVIGFRKELGREVYKTRQDRITKARTPSTTTINSQSKWESSLRTTGLVSSFSQLEPVSNSRRLPFTPPANAKMTDQVAAGIEGFFWPKIFWDFLTKNLDSAVKPFPILQIINVICGLVMLAWEWPLGIIAGSAMHRSIEARLVVLPLVALAAALLYQATNPAIYYTIGMVVYFWAYSEGEVSLHIPKLSNEVMTNKS
jgi:hypothetical protein